MKDSAADSDGQEAAADDIALQVKMEYVDENDGPNEPSPEAREAFNTIAIQSDHDEDDNEDNEDNDTQLSNDESTPPRLEMIDRETRAETSDTEYDTPVQLPGPPKRKISPKILQPQGWSGPSSQRPRTGR